MMTISMTRQWWEPLQKGAYRKSWFTWSLTTWDGCASSLRQLESDSELEWHWTWEASWDSTDMGGDSGDTGLSSSTDMGLWWPAVSNWRTCQLVLGAWVPPGVLVLRWKDNTMTTQRQYKDNAKTRHRRIPHTCQLALGCAYPCWGPGGWVSERAAGILSRLARFRWTVNCEL